MSLIQLSPSNGDSLLINSGTFSPGKIIRTRNELVFFVDQYGNSTGYRWLGNLPHTITGNEPSNDGGISSIAWESYITSNLYDKLKKENITLSWTAHLPTLEVAYGLVKGSLQVWTPGAVATTSQYWLYSDGTIWNGVGTLGQTPDTPFGVIHLQRDTLKYTYTVQTNGENKITVPYTFSDISVYLNGMLLNQSTGSFTINGKELTFAINLIQGDDIQCILNNVPVSSISYVAKSDLENYYTKADLNSNNGASVISTVSGLTIQDSIDDKSYVYPEIYRKPGMTDDDLWDIMFTNLATQSDFTSITNTPRMINLKGKTYTLLRTHQLDAHFGICNGTIYMNGGNIIMGDDAGTKTRRHALRNLHVEYIGTTAFNNPLISMARAYNTVVENCNFFAGLTNRARYGLYIGTTRAWGIKVSGGEYYGGLIPLRIGSTGDHTGIWIGGGITCHHGKVANLLLCNPAGFFIGGCNIEHSENNGIGLGITTNTNGSSNPAHAGIIEGVYFYNNGNGTTGTPNIPGAILIGYDIPNTTDWDNTGSLITSGSVNAHSISIKNCYIVSPKQTRAIKVKGLFGICIEDNKYSVTSTETIGFTFEGTCANSRCARNRNQGTGEVDLFEYSASTNPILSEKKGGYTPVLSGEVTAGANSYSSRGGYYSIADGMCTLSGWLTLSTVDPAMAGNLILNLPYPINAAQKSGCALNAINLASSANGSPVNGIINEGTQTISLWLQTGKLQPNNVLAGTAFHYCISYPVTLGTLMP